MDKVLNREQAAKYINMSPRNLNRLMAARFIPFIKTHFRKNPAKGRAYFSQKKLDAWQRRNDEDVQKMTELEKEMRYFNERDKEFEEQNLALEILNLSKTLLSCLDEGKNPNLSDKAREALERHSDDLSEYLDKIPELHALERRRLREFFEDDEECLFHYFPKTFEIEIRAGKRTNAGKPKESYGGVPLERFETYPGTKKPKEEKRQTVIEQADEVKK